MKSNVRCADCSLLTVCRRKNGIARRGQCYAKRPLGLFYLKEGKGYTGIDNRSGNVWTEKFATKAECLKWLKGSVERDE